MIHLDIVEKSKMAFNNGINDLQSMKLLELADLLRLGDQEFIEWLVQAGLLHGNYACPSCGNNMKLYGGEGTNSRKWTCNKRQCRDGNKKQIVGYMSGTFFEESRIDPKKIFHLSYLYLHQLGTLDQMMYEVGIASEAAVQWTQYFRDIMAEHFVANPTVVGGHGIHVEIDETSISKRKYNRGRLPGHQRQWMFGGIERGTKRCFMLLVDRRDAATLLPIIQQYILPGTTIHSDLWRAYGGIANLPGGYQHLTVNHSMNFVDPITGSHTQSIENTWGRFKKKIKKSHGLTVANNDRYTDYLQEFMWRQVFSNRSQILFNFWSQVATKYPCQ